MTDANLGSAIIRCNVTKLCGVSSLETYAFVASKRAISFRLEEGECVVVDNFLTAHGREAYTDLGRAMWQVWAWTNESLAVPPAAGPNREWLKRPTSGHAAAKDEVE